MVPFKTIINGVKYDTESSTNLCSFWNGLFNAKQSVEVLYRKKNGEYFLHVEGGAESIYADHFSSETDCRKWTGNEKIIPLTEAEAEEWVKDRYPEEYDEILGKGEKKDEK